MAYRKRVGALAVGAVSGLLALNLNDRASAQATTGGSSTPSAIVNDVNDPVTYIGDSGGAPGYDRGGNVSVAQRSRPDYQAIGLHLGGFTLYPKLNTTLSYDDNIFAQAGVAVSDTIVSLAPEINIQSNWSRNALSARLWAKQDSYFEHSSEDVTEYGGNLSGKLELGQTTLTGSATSARYVLTREDSVNIGEGFSTTRSPYDSTLFDAQLIHLFNRVRITAMVDYQIKTFQNGETRTGAAVVNDGLNQEVLTYAIKAEYAVTSDAAVYINAVGNDQHYPNRAPMEDFTRNSSGYDISVGANFDVTHLIRGELEVGYLNQTYTSSAVFKPISGPSVRGQLEWFPTQLTTVTFNGEHAVTDAVVPGSAGDTISTAKLQVDHELLRNLILSANASIGHDDYNGISRSDDRTSVGLLANWLIRRWLGLTFAYSYADQRSSGVAKGPGFSDNKISVSTVVQF
jgi:hypothetical protein